MPIFNYVREHRRFIRYASDHKLTSGERLLWYALVEIMNEQADGNVWTDDYIPISNNRLLALCDPMGTDTLMRARSRLKQRGLIDFRPGNRNRVNPAYRINLFYPEGHPLPDEKKEGYTQNAYNPGNNIQDNLQDNLQDNRQDNPEDNLQDNLRGRMQGNPGDIYINLNKDYTQTGKFMDDDDDDDGDSIARVRARGGRTRMGSGFIPLRAQRFLSAAGGPRSRRTVQTRPVPRPLCIRNSRSAAAVQ